MKTEELRYLQRLAELYPTIGKASQRSSTFSLFSICQREPSISFPISMESMRLFPMCSAMALVQCERK